MNGTEISIDELREKWDKTREQVDRLFAKLDQRAKDHEVWLEDMKKIRAEIDTIKLSITQEEVSV